MIFKQIDEILSGRKTQTRRVYKDGEIGMSDGPYEIYHVMAPPGRIKWEVGRTYAVVPKRGMPAVWWRMRDGNYETLTTQEARYQARAAAYMGEIKDGVPIPYHLMKPEAEFMREFGWHEMRIRITAIRPDYLQLISEADAIAEGVASVAEYRDLWERINGKTPGARWADNPGVWVLTFEMVR